MSKVLKKLKEEYKSDAVEELSMEDFLALAKKDKSVYSTAAERLLKAIGPSQTIETREDPRLGRIFSNQPIEVFDSFKDFFGMEKTILQIVGFLRHAAQGLEEKKQILYLLGPVGGGKSSLADRLKRLMEKEPFYAIKGSPIFESPLGFFGPEDSKDLGIPKRYLTGHPSPWAVKRLKEVGGDLSKLKVVKLFPSALKQIAISRTEPGDDNNQDISALVGKLDIRKLEDFAQNDPDAYSYSGGLCLGNRGLLEFVEMFKAPIKTLHPLLTATQEGYYNGTEALSAIPFDGIVIAHSNESEWESFKNNQKNEAFIDRVNMIRVPYCLRKTEEVSIYRKLLENSSLDTAPCAPRTLENLAEFCVLSRLVVPENSDIHAKMKVYDGENLKNKVKSVKSVAEYAKNAGPLEGFSGISTRFAFKILSKTFNSVPGEISADPTLLFSTLAESIRAEQFPEEVTNNYLAVHAYLVEEYTKFLDREIKKAYLESYSDYGQNIFDRYIKYAEFWLDDEDYRDPDSGHLFDLDTLNKRLEEIERPAGVSNEKDFRNEIVKYCLKFRAKNNGQNPSWSSYAKMREVIEKKIFSSTDEIIPIISFSKKATANEQQKHNAFVERMIENGYTEKQVRRVCDFYLIKKNDG